MPQFGAQIDTLRIPIKGLIPEQSATALSTPVEGLIWHDTVNKHIFVWLNGVWAQVDNAGATGPIGPAGGELAGTYPNPTVADNVIDSANIINGTIQAGDLAGGVIPTTLPPSGTAAGDLGGTYPSPTVVKATGTFSAGGLITATAGLAANGQRITNVGAPTTGADAVNKTYVDGLVSGLDVKASVRAASTANVGTYNASVAGDSSSMTAMPNTIDGVTLVGQNRVLLKNQTNPKSNGIWVVSTLGTGANGVWNRPMDFGGDASGAQSVTAGAFTFIEQGTTNADTGWVLTADNPITVDGASGSDLPWSQFSQAGAITAGAGLTQTGNTLDVGAGAGITVNADSVQVANNGITNAMIADGAINLATADVTGTLPITKGGTGGTTAAAARIALGAPTILSATVPALPSPGAYVTVPGIVRPAGGPMAVLTVGFGFAASGDTAGSGEVFLDWKTRGVAEDFQVKADIAVLANTYVVTVVMAS